MRGLFPLHLDNWAVIAAGKHLFPFRTEKLSPLAPMVLGAQAPGRVGRRPFLSADRAPQGARRAWSDLRRPAAARATRGRASEACGRARRRWGATRTATPAARPRTG